MRYAAQLAMSLVLGLLGCATEPLLEAGGTWDGDDGRADAWGSGTGTGLRIPVDPGVELELCPDRWGLNLTNAKGLALLAVNEYSHYRFVGPMLEELGFGAEGEGTRWAQCAADLDHLRELEDSGDSPLVITEEYTADWGECAREWYWRSFPEPRDTPASPAVELEHYLVHQVHPGATIEFFSERRLGLDRTYVEAGSTQVMWAQHRSLPIVVVAFRGTEIGTPWRRVSDVFTDLATSQTDVEGYGAVHSGFLEALGGVEELLAAKLAEVQGSGLRILVTGHSLGAALATLFAMRLLEQMDAGADLELAALYTYGSPRVGDPEFAAAFDDAAVRHGVTVARFRNGDDPVTAVPLSVPFLREYRHVAGLAFLSDAGDLLYGIEEMPYGSWDLDDHAPEAYYTRIGEAYDTAAYASLVPCAD